MMKKILSISVILLVVFMACTNKKAEEKQKLMDQISNLEKQFAHSDTTVKIDYQAGRDLVEAYKKYVKEYPNDTVVPGMMYKVGVMNLKYTGDLNEAIYYFVTLKEKFPKFAETPMALYTAAYIYNDRLKDFEKAKKCYQMLIDDYPDHYLAREAKTLIEFVGKSDEELLNAILKKNQVNKQQ